MRQNTPFLPILLALLLPAGLAAFAAPDLQETERFLQTLRFVESDKGAALALERLDGFAAKGVTDPKARLALNERRVVLLRKTKRLDEAFDLLENEFARKKIPPETALRVYESMKTLRERIDPPTIHDYRLIRALRLFLENPSIRKDRATTATFLLELARLYVDRRYNDQALPCFKEASSLLEDGDQKAEALFAAALAARDQWDIPASDAFLREIARIDGISFLTKKRIELLSGENAIFPVGHDWTPTPEALDKAHKLIEDALAERSPLQQSAEAQNVLYTLILAETKCGELQKAIQLGEKSLAGPMKLDHKLACDIAILVAETHDRLGDKKRAIKYYELGIGGDTPAKTIHLRIAELAISMQHFTRAIQAYTEAINCCDKVQEKGQIRRLTKKITRLNDRIRKNTKSVDTERFFTDTDEELGELTLDEE